MMTKFELVSNILNGSDAPDLKENVIYWNNGDKIATVNFDCNSRKASMIRKMAEKFPDEVKIFSDKNGGYMVASVPISFVKVSKRTVSEEQRNAMAERFRNLRDTQSTCEETH